MRNKTRIIALAILITYVMPTAHALAWNKAGHRLVALVAWEQLDAATRTKIVAKLKKHPRFDKDFKSKMPDKIRDANEATKDKWIFLHAATWPDVARSIKGADRKKYHHSTWHYINEPLFLTDEDVTAFADGVPVNLDKEWKSRMWSSRMNIIQALQKSTTQLKAQGTSGPDQAVYLCWLMHLVGDLHQPLHSTALFSHELFPDGDRGGNAIPTTSSGNLHSFWDGRAGSAKTLGGLQKKVKKWLGTDWLREAGTEAAINLDTVKWLEESHEFAFEFGYTEEILNAVAAAEPPVGHGDPKIEEINLSDDYRDMAKEVAVQRVVEAGYRLAEELKAVAG